MSGDLRDIKSPPERIAGATPGTFDLADDTGLELVVARILRLLWLTPGELLHRPTLGGGLETYRGKTPTAETLRRLNLSIRALLDALPYVESYSVNVERLDGSTSQIDIVVNVDGAALRIPTITLGA